MMDTVAPHTMTRAWLAAYLRLEAASPGFAAREVAPGLWTLRFGRAKGGLTDEALALDDGPPGARLPAVAQLLRGIGRPAFASTFTATPEATIQAWSSAGLELQLLQTEWLMTRALGGDAGGADDGAVRGVTTRADAERVNRAREREVIVPAYLDDPAIRFYTLDAGGEPVASAALVRVDRSMVVIEHVATLPGHRRRGYAARLIRALHADAARAGATDAVLLSSAEGRPLYERLGYRHVRAFVLFVPEGARLTT